MTKGELLLDHFMAMSPGVDDDTIIGIETVEPAFGMSALWISEEMKEQAELSGYTVVDPPSVVSTHLTEVIKRHAHELLGRQETKQLIDHLKEAYPTLVEDVTPNPLSTGEVQKVLASLLKEKVSIRNLPIIFETLADYGQMTKDTNLITEYVRQALSRQITKQYANPGEPLYVITTSGSLEKKIAEGVQQSEHGNFLALDPNDSQGIIDAVLYEVERMSEMGQMPILLCSPAVRIYIRNFLNDIYLMYQFYLIMNLNQLLRFRV